MQKCEPFEISKQKSHVELDGSKLTLIIRSNAQENKLLHNISKVIYQSVNSK